MLFNKNKTKKNMNKYRETLYTVSPYIHPLPLRKIAVYLGCKVAQEVIKDQIQNN